MPQSTSTLPRPAPPAAAAGVSRPSATVGAGLILLGVSATVYLVASARAVGAAGFGTLSMLWTLAYTFGNGAFLPFEQELGRAVASRAQRGEGSRPVCVRAAASAGVVLCFALAACSLFAFSLRDTSLFALGPALAAMAAQFLSRGMFSGSGRFGWYSAQLGVEGVVRALAAVALLCAGVRVIGPYAWVLAVAPLAALLCTLPGIRPAAAAALRPGPPSRWAEVSANLGWLLVSGLCAQAVANAAMVALHLLAPHSDMAGRFLAAFVIARVPLFLFQAVQAVLIPGLARALAAHDHAAFRRELRRVLSATSAVGLAGVLGSAGLGPWLLPLVFGSAFRLGRIDLLVLAASTVLYMLALVFQSGLVAIRRHRDNAIGWSVALAVFMLGCLLPLPPLPRVETALMASCVTAAALLCARLVVPGVGEVLERGTGVGVVVVHRGVDDARRATAELAKDVAGDGGRESAAVRAELEVVRSHRQHRAPDQRAGAEDP